MVDVLTPEQRLRAMRGNRSSGTKPELLLRALVEELGLWYLPNVRSLPGNPDVTVPGKRVALFVHGCFWHSHDCRPPRKFHTNPDFWHAKLARNVERHRVAEAELRREGWRVLVVWECEINKSPERARKRVHGFLNKGRR